MHKSGSTMVIRLRTSKEIQVGAGHGTRWPYQCNRGRPLVSLRQVSWPPLWRQAAHRRHSRHQRGGQTYAAPRPSHGWRYELRSELVDGELGRDFPGHFRPNAVEWGQNGWHRRVLCVLYFYPKQNTLGRLRFFSGGEHHCRSLVSCSEQRCADFLKK